MLKPYLLSLIVLLCASPVFAQRDAIDLSRAVVVNSPADVASWPITSRVESLTMSPEGAPNPGIAMYFNGRNTWPNYHVPGWAPGGEGLQYTIWAGVNINGVWHVSGFIQMWRSRVATGAPILTVPAGCPLGNNFSCNWAYDGRWGAMNHYVPHAGESMVFFATAGNARGVGTVTSVRERTNVVMVTLPPNDSGSWSFPANQTDLLIDLGGNGLWTLLDSASYGQINPGNARAVATGDVDGNGMDEVLVDFGPGAGVWLRWNGANWTQLHTLSGGALAMGYLDNNNLADIVISFPGAGVWALYNGATWGQIHSLNPSRILVGDIDGGGGDLIMDFPGAGIWIRRSSGAWSQLHPMSPIDMAIGDFDGNGYADIALAFQGAGVWMFRNGSTWVQVNPLSVSRLAAGNLDNNNLVDLVIDFGPGYGLWMFRNMTTWTKIHSATAEQVLLTDLDGNGQAEVVIDFGPGSGVWILANSSAWLQAYTNSPELIVAGSFN